MTIIHIAKCVYYFCGSLVMTWMLLVIITSVLSTFLLWLFGKPAKNESTYLSFSGGHLNWLWKFSPSLNIWLWIIADNIMAFLNAIASINTLKH